MKVTLDWSCCVHVSMIWIKLLCFIESLFISDLFCCTVIPGKVRDCSKQIALLEHYFVFVFALFLGTEQKHPVSFP